MDNKEILKSYEQICSMLKQNKTEEVKQQFLILFKELEIQLNKTFDEKMEQLSYTARNLREEIKRIDVIMSLIKNRREFRTRMISDHKKFLGYEPLELDEIEAFEQIEDFMQYKQNLMDANKIMIDLIKSGKKLKGLRSQLERNPKNSNYINTEIEKISRARTELFDILKNNEAVLEDIYSYCLTAPFNEENAYIEYILIKLNPKSELKINLNEDNKRSIKSRMPKEESKPQDIMPVIDNIGSVKPNNLLDNLTEAVNENNDINIPTNGLVENENTIQITEEEL